MILAQAIDVQPGRILCSPYTAVPYAPYTVKLVWVSEDKRFVRFLLAKYKEQWVDHGPWILVPEDLEWNAKRAVWHVKGNPSAYPLKLERDPEPAEETI